MKKSILSFITSLLILTIFVTLLSPIGVSAKSETSITKNQTYSVYNAQGELVGVVDDLSKAEQVISMNSLSLRSNTTSMQITSAGKLLATVRVIMKVIAGVIFLSYQLTGVDLNAYLRTYVSIPIINALKIMYFYSRDGNTSSPYPPNSYEGAMWKRNNFYIVVENWLRIYFGTYSI